MHMIRRDILISPYADADMLRYRHYSLMLPYAAPAYAAFTPRYAALFYALRYAISLSMLSMRYAHGRRYTLILAPLAPQRAAIYAITWSMLR